MEVIMCTGLLEGLKLQVTNVTCT